MPRSPARRRGGLIPHRAPPPSQENAGPGRVEGVPRTAGPARADERRDEVGVGGRHERSRGELGQDERAGEFEAFVLEAREGLVALGVLLTGDVAVAQDLAQETLVRAWQRWSRVRRYDRPLAWSRHVLHNLAVDHLRRRGRAAVAASGRSETTTLQVEDGELLEAIRSLEPAPRKALFLHYFLGLPIAQVAEELGVPTGTVAAWLSRSRTTIAARLDRSRPRGGEEG